MDAGWYNDPFGRFAQRYHDGDDWTAHVSAGDGRSFTDPSGTSALVAGAAPNGPATWAPPTATDASGRAFDLGGPWHRIAASILDALITAIPLAVISLATIDWSNLEEVSVTSVGSSSFNIASIAIGFLYPFVTVGVWGRTIGQMATSLRVAREADRAVPTWGVASIRAGAALLYSVPFVGWIFWVASVVMLFADRKRQTIHDKIAKTVVVMA